MTHAEEMELVRSVLNGNVDAFEPLIEGTRKKVYSLALRLTNSEQDALDMSQEAYLKAYSCLGYFRGDSGFSTWIYRITYNLCIDFLRNKRHISAEPLDGKYDGGENKCAEIPSDKPLPNEIVEQKELCMEIAKGLSTLSEDHRNTFLLRELSGMSYREIAKAMYVNEGTVKSRLARARRRLAAYLIKSGTFPKPFRQTDDKEVMEHD